MPSDCVKHTLRTKAVQLSASAGVELAAGGFFWVPPSDRSRPDGDGGFGNGILEMRFLRGREDGLFCYRKQPAAGSLHVRLKNVPSSFSLLFR